MTPYDLGRILYLDRIDGSVRTSDGSNILDPWSRDASSLIEPPLTCPSTNPVIGAGTSLPPAPVLMPTEFRLVLVSPVTIGPCIVISLLTIALVHHRLTRYYIVLGLLHTHPGPRFTGR